MCCLSAKGNYFKCIEGRILTSVQPECRKGGCISKH